MNEDILRETMILNRDDYREKKIQLLEREVEIEKAKNIELLKKSIQVHEEIKRERERNELNE